MINNIYSVGEKIIVIEHTPNGEIFEWEGEVSQVTESFVETVHRRNSVTHPQWHQYARAYEKTWIKHYFHPNNELNNIKNI